MARMTCEQVDGEFRFSQVDGDKYCDLTGAVLADTSESGLTGAAVFPLDGQVDDETLAKYPFEMVGYYFSPYLMTAGSNWLTKREFNRIKRVGIADSINPDM